MMDIFNEALIPFYGTEHFKFYETMDKIVLFLNQQNISYRKEIWSDSSETVPNPWTVIVISGFVSLFFAGNNKLFKIVCWDKYTGKLPNGIGTGDDMSEASQIDFNLSFNDWDEIWESPTGYWLEDDLDTNKITSISIFIREIDDEEFDLCTW